MPRNAGRCAVAANAREPLGRRRRPSPAVAVRAGVEGADVPRGGFGYALSARAQDLV